MTKKLYLLETISIHKMLYAVEASSENEVENLFNEGVLIQEMGQDYMGEITFSTQEITKDQYIEIFDKINDYLKKIPKKDKEKFIYKEGKNKERENIATSTQK